MGAARRAVRSYARGIGFGENDLADIDIVVQEIGTNAVRYATGGGALHFTTPLGGEPGLELFYRDKGPGIHNLGSAARDGVSTGGSLGAGLGAIRRLMDEVDICSTVDTVTNWRVSFPNKRHRTTHGTALLARKWAVAHSGLSTLRPAAPLRIGAWSRPREGEIVNGDAYVVREHGGRVLLAVIDGLGHGSGAHAAAHAALRCLEQWTGEPVDELMWTAHEALGQTRGAVMSVVVIDTAGRHLHYAGVGNVDVRVFNSPEPIRPVPVNGTLGARLAKVRVSAHPWAEGMIVVMTSDGISQSWDVSSYPGLLGRDPQLLAGVLMRDYERPADDATVLVVRR